MLRITKITDYAFLVSCALARAEGPTPCSELATLTGLPKPTVSKVLKILCRKSIITSTRGTNGGYELSLSSDKLTARHLIEAVEGPIAVTECTGETPQECCHVSRCGLQANWHRINQTLCDALDGITIAEMAKSEAEALIQLGISVPQPSKDDDKATSSEPAPTKTCDAPPAASANTPPSANKVGAA